MISKRFTLVLTFVLVFSSLFFANGESEFFPAFNCESFKGEIITEDYIKENDIRIIIYGSPKSLNKNRDHLDRVLEFIKSVSLEDKLLYIVNFNRFPQILRNQIKKKMARNSNDLGIKIFAEWNGQICEEFSRRLVKSEILVFILGEKYEIDESMTKISSENLINKISEIQPRTSNQ